MDKSMSIYAVLITLLVVSGIVAFYYAAQQPESYDLESRSGSQAESRLAPRVPAPSAKDRYAKSHTQPT